MLYVWSFVEDVYVHNDNESGGYKLMTPSLLCSNQTADNVTGAWVQQKHSHPSRVIQQYIHYSMQNIVDK